MATKEEPTNEGKGMETDQKASNLQGELCLQNLLNDYIKKQTFQSPITTLLKAF